jgi:hypothetical protein
MKELQIKFSSQFLAMFLLVTHVKSKKTCKPGQEDVTSQQFDLSARGECETFFVQFLEIPDNHAFRSKLIPNRKSITYPGNVPRLIHLNGKIKYNTV